MLGYIKTIVVDPFYAYAVLKFKRNYRFLSIDYFKSAHYIRWKFLMSNNNAMLWIIKKYCKFNPSF